MAPAMGIPQRRELARKEPAPSGLLGLPGPNVQPHVGRVPKREVVDVLCLGWQGTQLKAVLGMQRNGKIAQRAHAEGGPPGQSGQTAVLHVAGGRGIGGGCVVFYQETQGNVWAKGSRRRNAERRFVHHGHPGETGVGAVQPAEEEAGSGDANVNHRAMRACVSASLLIRGFVKMSREFVKKGRSGADGESGGRVQGAAGRGEKQEGGDVPFRALQGLACSPRPVPGLGRRRGCVKGRIARGQDARI